MGLGSILIAVVKFLLKSVLFILKAVLYGAKLFLLLFVLVARVFLIFAKAAVPQYKGAISMLKKVWFKFVLWSVLMVSGCSGGLLKERDVNRVVSDTAITDVDVAEPDEKVRNFDKSRGRS